jgi:5-methyltetrahydropteroyltriglutamate--homocysteine methyltransferase
VAEVVRQQADVGIDVVSDGEFSKGLNWAFYIFKRLKGIAVRPATPEELQDPMSSMVNVAKPPDLLRRRPSWGIA